LVSQPIVAYVVLIIVYLLFSSMDPSIRRRRLIVRGAAMVAVMSAWFFIRFRRMTSRRRGITCGPMSVRDQERAANLRFIHDSNDTSCVPAKR
jgi:hypothetical protein